MDQLDSSDDADCADELIDAPTKVTLHGGGRRMLLFIIKIYRTLKRVIAARKFPHQLAWAVAFGVLLGIVPHGNLLALATLLVILCLKLNHSAMGLTAIASSFAATLLDPVSHWVGKQMLSNEHLHSALQTAWTWPLMPWTDLNNTVVIGSFTVGVLALAPIFMLTYPFFRWAASINREAAEDSEVADGDAAAIESAGGPLDDGLQVVTIAATNNALDDNEPLQLDTENEVDSIEFEPVLALAAVKKPVATDQDEPLEHAPLGHQEHPASASSSEEVSTVETRIDILRTAPLKIAEQTSPPLTLIPPPHSDGASADPVAMDEALNYLLRQLRDQQTGEAA